MLDGSAIVSAKDSIDQWSRQGRPDKSVTSTNAFYYPGKVQWVFLPVYTALTCFQTFLTLIRLLNRFDANYFAFSFP